MQILHTDVFWVPANRLVPSQYAINKERLQALLHDFSMDNLSPIPVIRLRDEWVMTDGHHRAACLLKKGYTALPVVLDRDELDLNAYSVYVNLCKMRGVYCVSLLPKRIASDEAWQEWNATCDRINVEAAYLRSPSAWSSLPIWKERKMKEASAPPRVKKLSDLTDEDGIPEQIFIRSIHDLQIIQKAPMPEGFEVVPVDLGCADAVPAICGLIDRSYQKLRVTPEDVHTWQASPVFAPELWFWLIKTQNKQKLGLIVCEADREFQEGIIEWFQVDPSCHNRGLGTTLLTKALFRMQEVGLSFASVCYDAQSFAAQAVYRKAGFAQEVPWAVFDLH
ncbi:MAG: GNAT family N-acetyltransferase [Christensenellales bacterium]